VAENPGDFGNARGVRNVFEKILTEQANRIAAMPEVTRDELMRVTLADVKTALYGEEAAKEDKPEGEDKPAEPAEEEKSAEEDKSGEEDKPVE